MSRLRFGCFTEASTLTPGSGSGAGSSHLASRAREEERHRTRAFDPGPSRVVAGLVARKTPHRIRPRTADSASPPGEGEEPRRLRGRGGVLQGSPGEGEDRWPWRTVFDFGLAASPRQPPSPQPSPSRAREEERHRTRAFDPGPSRVVDGMVARKTPHRIRPKTADSASPLGEGEESPRLRGRGGVLQRSPGEGEERRPGRRVLDFGLAASLKLPPSPQPSPSREREKEWPRFRSRGGVLKRAR